MDAAEFRRRVAGLVDPNRKPTGAAESASVKDEAVLLCLAMCDLFGDTLDRKTLWDKIPAALRTAAAKCDDGDTDRFAALCLETIKADDGCAARHPGLTNWLLSMASRDGAYRQAFVQHCGGKAAIVAVHGRAAWERTKQSRAAAKGGDQ